MLYYHQGAALGCGVCGLSARISWLIIYLRIISFMMRLLYFQTFSVLTLSFYDDEGRNKLKVYGEKFIWFYNKLYTQAKNI